MRYVELAGLILLSVFLISCDKDIVVTGPDTTITGTVALYADSGASPGCSGPAQLMFEWMGHTVVRIYAEDVNAGSLNGYDLIYFPGGSSQPYMDEINDEGDDNIREFVRRGGGYIGTCAGACFACNSNIWRGYEYDEGLLGLYPGAGDGPINEIYPYPEHGMCLINYAEPPHPINANLGDTEWIYYWWGPYFIPDSGTNTFTVGYYDITGQPALVCCEYGEGRVFLTGPHPEWEEDSDRDGYPPDEEYDDHGSDWPLMKYAAAWCMGG